MTIPLVWTHGANQDLVAIEDRIALDDPDAGARWVDKLIAAAEAIAPFPQRGRRVPELGRDDVREVIKGAYRNRIEVLAVLEGHRLLPDLEID